MDQNLTGKYALVTGGGRGIGRAIAKRMAASGAVVFINYAQNSSAADATVADIKASGGDAIAVQTALGSEAAAGQLRDRVLSELQMRYGADKLDILVNNIGGGEYARIADTTEAYYDQVMANNLRAPFFVTKLLADHLRDFGRIINISSTGSRLTDPGIITYTMAKAALEAFTRVLAAELGPRGITVNAVGPGFTAGETNLHVMEDPVLAAQVIDNTLLRRFGQPEEIADIVWMLASDAGRWITAQTIDASGGFKR